jgi:L-lactate dehydrogenase
MTSIFAKIGKIKQSSIIVVISNPVDILTKIIQDIVPLPNSQIFGTGTSLDTARLKTELGLLLGVSPQSIEGYVMGEHGDTEFVAWDSVTVGGIPARKIRDLNVSVRKRTEERVRKEAYNIIKKKGATYFGIAQVAVDILEAILYDQKKILPVCALLTRYNGVSGICLGAPAVVGRNGVERHWPLELRGNEKKRFQASAKKIKSYL